MRNSTTASMPTEQYNGDPQWWRAGKPGGDDDEAIRPHHACWAIAMGLVNAGSSRLQALRMYRDLYVDRQPEESEGTETDEARDVLPDSRDRVARKNVIASACDTMNSQQIKNRPRPWLVTVGGDWEAWNRARLAGMWIDGFFEHAGVYELGDLCDLDSKVYGTGVCKVWEDDTSDLPQLERVYPGELWTDPREESVGKLRTLYHVRGVDREVLAEAYPEHAEEIRSQQRTASVANLEPEGAVDMVSVVEAWRLPTPKGGGGRHVICTETATLYDEEWTDDAFPFVFMYWRRDPMHSTGIGLAEQLVGTQIDVNELEATLCEAYRRQVAAWLIPRGSLPPEKLSNAIGTYYVFDESKGPPQYYTPPAVSADLLARSSAQIESAFHLAGVSQLSAAMMKPAGLNSGIALQNYQDVESQRHVMAGRSYERFYCELAKRILRCADRLLERLKRQAAEARERGDEDVDGIDEDVLTMYGGKRSLRAVKYSAASLGKRPHMVRVFPTSALAQTPAARLQQVNDMWNMGLIDDRSSMLELLSFPDLDRYTEQQLGGHWEVDELIDAAIDGTELDRLDVHSYMDHPYLRKRATQLRSVAKLRGAPDRVLEAVDYLIQQADVWITKATPPAPPAMPGMPTGGAPALPNPMTAGATG